MHRMAASWVPAVHTELEYLVTPLNRVNWLAYLATQNRLIANTKRVICTAVTPVS